MTDLEKAIEDALEHHEPEPLGAFVACSCQPAHAMSPAVYRRHAASIVAAALVEASKRRLEQAEIQRRQQARISEVMHGSGK